MSLGQRPGLRHAFSPCSAGALQCISIEQVVGRGMEGVTYRQDSPFRYVQSVSATPANPREPAGSVQLQYNSR